MGILRVTVMILLLSIVSLPVVGASTYMRIVDVASPDSVVAGQTASLRVTVEYSSLYGFMAYQGNPTVRLEICEGTDVSTCRGIAFAPSENGEEIKDTYTRPLGTKTYEVNVQSPQLTGIWHLIAIFEITSGGHAVYVRRGDWVVISSAGYDAWREFDVIVKPNETSTLTWQRILTEDFESGLGGWEANGLVSVVSRNPINPIGSEGHSGQFAVLLGIRWDEQDIVGNAGEFLLEKTMNVIPGSILTVTFWVREVCPQGGGGGGFLFSVVPKIGTIDDMTILFSEKCGEEALWRSVKVSTSVPTSQIILQWHGSGWGQPNTGMIGYEIDDISVDQGAFSTTTTTLVSTTAAMSETRQTQTPASTTNTGVGSGTLPLDLTFLQMTWPYMIVVIAAVAAGVLLLIRARRIRGKPIGETKAREPAPKKKPAYCYHCGAPIPTYAEYCRLCGKKQAAP